MFLGHFAVGFAAKRLAPPISLGTQLLACQLLDLIWPVFVLTGIERVRVDHDATAFTPLDFSHYPWSHSLLMSLVWSAVFSGLLKMRRHAAVHAFCAAAVVTSHWLLDLLSHRADLPLWPTGPRVGLGLWRSVPATLAVELGLFASGIYLYVRSTEPKRRAGHLVTWSLVAFLLLVYAGNAFGPKPPPAAPAAMIAGPALAMWLIVAWGYWADRLRKQRAAARQQ